jgi:hypothetical protein
MNQTKSLSDLADAAIDAANAQFNQKILNERDHQRLTPAPAIVIGWRGSEIMLQSLGPDQLAGNQNMTTGAIAIGDAPAVRGDRVFSTPRVSRSKPPTTTAEVTGKIKYLYSVLVEGEQRFYVGGWQKQVVLVTSFPANAVQSALINNFGGKRWSVDFIYTEAGVRYAATYPNEDTEPFAVPFTNGSYAPVSPKGYGFWVGQTLAVLISSVNTVSTVLDPPDGHGNHQVFTADSEISSVSGGAVAVKIWDQELTTRTIPNSSSSITTYTRDTSDYAFSGDRQNNTASITQSHRTNNAEHRSNSGPTWLLPDLIVDNTDTLTSTLNEAFDGYTSSTTVNGITTIDDTPLLPGHRDQASSASAITHSAIKINEDGTTGLAYRTAFASSRSLVEDGNPLTVTSETPPTFTGSVGYLWLDTGAIATTAPEGFSPDSQYLDAFDTAFSALKLPNSPLLKDTTSSQVVLYSDTFEKLRTIGKLKLYGATNVPTNLVGVTFYGASYHP